MQEQELFQGYEVKNWDFSPRLYKILAVSAIFNILALLVIGQTNLLTKKGCDSPLVGRVCQVIDTIYVGGSIMSTDSQYVSKDFDPTELQDAEIIWVDRTGDDQFKYPEGYFAQSNPDSTLQEINDPTYTFPTNIPGINSPNGGGSLLDKPQVLPKENVNPTIGPLPDSPLGTIGGNPTIPRSNKFKRFPNKPKNNPLMSNNSPNLPKLNPDPTTDKNSNKPDKNLTANNNQPEVEINKEPMKKFASDVKAKFEKKEIDLSQNFTVVADGVLTNDGKLDVTPDEKTKEPKSRILKAEGNPQMIEVAKQAISAIGDSGWLGYLRAQGVEKINFTVVQDNDNLQVIITSDQPTPERASTVTSGLNGIIQGALLLDKNGLKKLGDDEKVLLNNAKTTVNPDNKKQFVLNFVLPKQTALDMITRKLNEPEEKSSETKPNGSTAQIKDSNKNTAK